MPIINAAILEYPLFALARRSKECLPPEPSPESTKTGRVLVVAHAGSWYSECVWAAEEMLRHEQGVRDLSHVLHCRRFHEDPDSHSIVKALHRARSPLLLWLDNPFMIAFSSMGFDAVIVLEGNQIFRTVPWTSRAGRVNGRSDFEPTSFERALDHIRVPVLRLWVVGDHHFDEKHSSRCAYVHDYNNGRNAIIRLLGTGQDPETPTEQEVARCLANLVGWLAKERPNSLDEREIADGPLSC